MIAFSLTSLYEEILVSAKILEERKHFYELWVALNNTFEEKVFKKSYFINIAFNAWVFVTSTFKQ